MLSNWGDQFYLGLNGIDIFDSKGRIITDCTTSTVRKDGTVSKASTVNSSAVSSTVGITSIEASPSGMNALPEYLHDPRVVGNLIDGCNLTKDDLHVWLAPLLEHSSNIARITIEFSKAVQLSMLRIFNYNKSRTHVQRGIRHCRIFLEHSVIFEGEIQIANGELNSANDCSEVILFTVDENILANIANYDSSAGYFKQDTSDTMIQNLRDQLYNKRPSTGDKDKDPKQNNSEPQVLSVSTNKPTPANMSKINSLDFLSVPGLMASQETKTIKSVNNKISHDIVMKKSLDLSSSDNFNNLMNEMSAAMAEGDELLRKDDEKVMDGQVSSIQYLIPCRSIRLILHNTWGDSNSQYIGLAGVDVLEGDKLLTVLLHSTSITAEPRGMCSIGFLDDLRVPENVINGINDVTDDRYMWLAPYAHTSTSNAYTSNGHMDSKNFIKFDLGKVRNIAGIRVWNYNKCGENVLRGVREMSVEVDGSVVCTCILRMGPGSDGVSFAQMILFKDVISVPRVLGLPAVSVQNVHAMGESQSIKGKYVKYVTPGVKQDYEVPMELSGLLWKIVLYENWGDEYYIGLDGIEMLDVRGRVIDLSACNAVITAVPYAVRDIADKGDMRVPGNIFHYRQPGGEGDMFSSLTSWLAPLSRSMTSIERNTCVHRVLNCQKPKDNNNSYFESYKKKVQDGQVDQVNLPIDNVIFVMFPYPVVISGIRFYNYSKTPDRGVKDFGIHVDDRLVYLGELKRYIPEDQQKQVELFRMSQNVVFSNDVKVVRAERDGVEYCGASEQDVLYINERQVMVRSKDMYSRRPSVAAEGVYVDVEKRPTTSFVR